MAITSDSPKMTYYERNSVTTELTADELSSLVVALRVQREITGDDKTELEDRLWVALQDACSPVTSADHV